MNKRALGFVLALAMTGLAACGSASAPTPVPTATPSPMANKLIVYGDTVYFAGKTDPNTCVEQSRYKSGQAVGFRMTAIDPVTGKVDDAATLVVHVTFGGKTVDVPMNYRGTGANPHPGMWTGKWVVPNDAPTGIVKYVVSATDKQGRTGEFQPFNVDASELAVVK